MLSSIGTAIYIQIQHYIQSYYPLRQGGKLYALSRGEHQSQMYSGATKRQCNAMAEKKKNTLPITP